MLGKSHIRLGNYLLDHYLPAIRPICARAFLLGCIQPDRNPTTYLKGSLRQQWLRGHNYKNASRFMQRISLRLERRTSLNLFDYYTLGKLIHYTADAFTYAHNDSFCGNLSKHRNYEICLQEHFLQYLSTDPQVDIQATESIVNTIMHHHKEYQMVHSNFVRDSQYALKVCCCVLTIVLAPG